MATRVTAGRLLSMILHSVAGVMSSIMDYNTAISQMMLVQQYATQRGTHDVYKLRTTMQKRRGDSNNKQQL